MRTKYLLENLLILFFLFSSFQIGYSQSFLFIPTQMTEWFDYSEKKNLHILNDKHSPDNYKSEVFLYFESINNDEGDFNRILQYGNLINNDEGKLVCIKKCWGSSQFKLDIKKIEEYGITSKEDYRYFIVLRKDYTEKGRILAVKYNERLAIEIIDYAYANVNNKIEVYRTAIYK